MPSLLQHLKQHGEYGYLVWLDNLSTSERLLDCLRSIGYGAADTVRKGGAQGTDTMLVQLKEKHEAQLG